MGESTGETLAEQQYQAGLEAFRRGDNQECRRLSRLALDTATGVGSARVQALAHVGLSRAAFREADYDEGLRHAGQADELARGCGASREAMMALHMRAEITRTQGRYDDAVPLYRELLALDEQSGDKHGLAMEHYNLASVLLQSGDLSGAEQHLSQSLELAADDEHQLPYTLLGLAGLAARQGDVHQAGLVLGAVEAQLAAWDEVLDPAEAAELETHVQAGRSRDAEAFDSCRAERLPLDQARALVLDGRGGQGRAGEPAL